MADVVGVLKFAGRSAKRVAVFIVGAALVLAGLVMMVTPGPGLVLIVIGLAVLATEFAWAAALRDKARDQALAAKEKAAARVRRRRSA